MTVAFSDKNIAAAIARLPSTSTKDIRNLRALAEAKSLPQLASACAVELSTRPIEFSAETAAANQQMAEQVRDMSLVEAVRHAFTKVRPPHSEEVTFLRLIAANPGTSYQDAEKLHGKGDLGLVIGHLVYDRYGCFRKFITEGADQSSVLLIKERSGPSVRYTLKPEAADALAEIGII